MAVRRGRAIAGRGRRVAPSRPPLDRASAGCYETHLADKVASVSALLKDVLGGARLQVVPSPPEAFRHKCGFGVWKRKGASSVGFSMPHPRTGESVQIHSHFAVSHRIAQMMRDLIDPLHGLAGARRGLCTFTMFSTLGAACAEPDHGLVALGYNVPLGPEWRDRVAVPTAAAICAVVVGRGPGQERVAAGPDGALHAASHLVQYFDVGGTLYPQHRRDGIFAQCNTPVCGRMLRWAVEHAAAPDAAMTPARALLFEPYCGNGSFTLPLAPFFDRVLASDSTLAAVEAARACAALTGAHNVEVSVADAAAACGQAPLRRALARGGGGVTALLNPPREGVGRAVIETCRRASRVIYVSCSPRTLRRDLLAFGGTHRVTAAALFDQFPFSAHAEVGVALMRRQRVGH